MENEEKPGGRKWHQFTLRDLLLLAMLIALAFALGRQYRETGRLKEILQAYGLNLEAGDLRANQFRVYVNELSAHDALIVRQVVIETIGQPDISYTWCRKASGSVSFAAGSGNGPLVRTSVLVVADLVKTQEATDQLQTLLQPSTGGGIRDGLAVPKGSRLEELLKMDLVPGVYPRGTVLSVCTLQGESCTLTVN